MGTRRLALLLVLTLGCGKQSGEDSPASPPLSGVGSPASSGDRSASPATGAAANVPTRCPDLTLHERARHEEKLASRIAFAPDGKTWFSTGGSSGLIVWRGDVPGPIGWIEAGNSLTVLDDGRVFTGRVVFDPVSGTSAPVAAGTSSGSRYGDGYDVRDLALSGKGDVHLLSYSFRPPLSVIEYDDTGKKRYRPVGPTKPSGPDRFVAAVRVSDGERLATLVTDESVGGASLGTRWTALVLLGPARLAVWPAGRWAVSESLDLGAGRPMQHLVASPGEERLLLYGGMDNADPRRDQGHAVVIASGPLRERAHIRTTSPIHAASFVPGTTCVVTGTGDGRLDVWNVDGHQPQSIAYIDYPPRPKPNNTRPFSQRISAIAASPDGKTLVVALDLNGDDVFLYDLQ